MGQELLQNCGEVGGKRNRGVGTHAARSGVRELVVFSLTYLLELPRLVA